MNIDDDTLDALIASADPVAGAHLTNLDAEFDALLARVIDAPEAAVDLGPRRWRRLSRGAVAALTAGAVLAGGGVAAAGWHSAHTGKYFAGDLHEIIDLGGDDLPALAHELAKGIPYPPGDSADAYIPVVFVHSGVMTSDGVSATLAWDAECAWQGYWLQADRDGDSTARKAAAGMLRQVPEWPALAGHEDSTTTDAQNQIAASALAGDPTLVRQAWTANCTELPREWADK